MTDITGSYIATLAAADAYFAERLFSTAWSEATEADQTIALQMATRAIDRLPFTGIVSIQDQLRQFPRAYMEDDSPVSPWMISNMSFVNGWYVVSDVPQEVLDACCEEAIALLARGDHPRLEAQRMGVQQIQLGTGAGLQETYRADARGQGLISQEARELLAPYLAGSVRII